MGSDPLFTDGVIVIDKPAGPTSHDVVAVMRRALGRSTMDDRRSTMKVGHTGTLDPLASGVLPLVIGKATRLAQFLSSAEKEYEADIELGVTTTTLDRGGDVVDRDRTRAVAEVTPQMIEDAVAEFRGTYLQQPPAFSAKKIDGDRAYDLARRNAPVQLQPVEGDGDGARRRRMERHHAAPAPRVLRRLLRAVAGRRHRRAPRDRRASGRARADAQRRLHAGRRCRAGHAGSTASRGCRADRPTHGAAAVAAGDYPDSRRSLTGSPRRIHSTLAPGMPVRPPPRRPCAAITPGRAPRRHRRASRR